MTFHVAWTRNTTSRERGHNRERGHDGNARVPSSATFKGTGGTGKK